ncbi:MAG: DUF2442 domain-containing protein [Cyanobacteria bacterium NC_groundwater_1444_Ag_S-0.65um_54_12]|nr:DUF2442 domain-containing protein [Cyanobacteria bacterium NC_groundwater_1444_Ag_S-0.65um_54_12]
MVQVIRPTEADLVRGKEAGERAKREYPTAIDVTFMKASGLLVLTLATGVSISIPLSFIEELRDLEPEMLDELEIDLGGKGVVLESTDVHISVEGLVLDALGAPGWKKAIRAHLLREVAGIRSERKAAAARENGKKGGRPKKATNG